ncbi:MAG TPA: hypothetical protein VJS66_09440 [Burkholderiales bacterium]|nr:hypothetical protein [Burkholderiales bacterium]
MISKDKGKEEKRVSYTETAKYLNQGLEHADPMRLEGLTELQRVRAVKGANLQREHARLTQKLGATHPRVTALKQKLDNNAALERDLELGVKRAQTPAVFPEANSWTLHGHVRNVARKGVPNMTVALYDDRKKWIEEGGHACTDADGYFRLTVKSEKGIKRDTDIKRGQEIGAGAKLAGLSFAADNSIDASRLAVYIHVTDTQGHKRFIDENSIEPKLDEVVYREIIIDDDGCECTPPDGQPSKPDDKPEKEGRYLGNRKSHELHDLNNTKTACRIDEIKASQREPFSTQKEALEAGYDFCAHCFAKGKSKR